MKIWRGVKLADSLNQLQNCLDKHLNEQDNKFYGYNTPQLEIGGIRLPPYLETLGIFAVGSPGSGKTQVIAKLIETIRQREDFRLVCFDRNGEFTQKFYQEDKDLLFNPDDARSVTWCHRAEPVRYETVTASIVDEGVTTDPFWPQSAKAMLADVYDRTENNAEVWASLSELSAKQLQKLLQGSTSGQCFDAEKTRAGIQATLNNYVRFYRHIPDSVNPISFYKWGQSNSKSLFLPLFEDAAELYKPLYSMVFELIIRGLLSDTSRNIKTAIVVDELGALNQLPSLPRLLSEGRKFKSCPILATQTEAQIRQTYGDNNTRIILQGLATKVIFNCRDYETAEIMSGYIGKQERVSELSGSFNESKQQFFVRETWVVMPSELQFLAPLSGYLVINSNVPPALIQITPKSYKTIAPGFVPSVDNYKRTSGFDSLVQRYKLFEKSHHPLPVSAYEGFF